MRLIGPLLFLLIGVLVACTLRLVLGRGAPSLRFAVVIGIAGALLGLWLRDIFDLVLGDPFYGAVIASAGGAALLTLLVSIGLRRSRGRQALRRSDHDTDRFR